MLKQEDRFAQFKDGTSGSISFQLLITLFPFCLGKNHVHKVKILFLKCNSIVSLSFMTLPLIL